MISAQENSPINSTFIVEKDRLVKLENTARFFTELKAVQPISAIYYPAPGMDDSLNSVFAPSEITYVNREKTIDGVTIGDFREIKLPSESQDVVFIQDAHEKPKDIIDFVRVLKKNGLLVYSLYGCGVEMLGSRSFEFVQQLPTLEEDKMILKQWQKFFRTFRKV